MNSRARKVAAALALAAPGLAACNAAPGVADGTSGAGGTTASSAAGTASGGTASGGAGGGGNSCPDPACGCPILLASIKNVANDGKPGSLWRYSLANKKACGDPVVLPQGFSVPEVVTWAGDRIVLADGTMVIATPATGAGTKWTAEPMAGQGEVPQAAFTLRHAGTAEVMIGYQGSSYIDKVFRFAIADGAYDAKQNWVGSAPKGFTSFVYGITPHPTIADHALALVGDNGALMRELAPYDPSYTPVEKKLGPVDYQSIDARGGAIAWTGGSSPSDHRYALAAYLSDASATSFSPALSCAGAPCNDGYPYAVVDPSLPNAVLAICNHRENPGYVRQVVRLRVSGGASQACDVLLDGAKLAPQTIVTWLAIIP